MCFKGSHKNVNIVKLYNTTDYGPKTANRDIVCYKVLNNDCTSEVMRFKYRLNKVYKGPLIPIKTVGTEDTYFDKDKIIIKLLVGVLVHRGFHSYRTLSIAKSFKDYNNEMLVKCVIPKGSKYYESEEQYVSNSIRIIKKYK